MFKFSKNFFYMIGIVILFSKMFACAGSGGGGCIPLELIPEGYRSQQYQEDNPVLTNVTQVRITQTGFDYVKDNIGEIIKAIMPDMYMEPDANDNARVRICVPPQYGAQVGFEYGVASACDKNHCDVCGKASGSSGSLCPNTLTCFNGDEGSDLIITLLKNSLVLEAQDDGTDADKIHGSVSLSISNIPFWTNGIWPVDHDNAHTECNAEIVNSIPVSLDIDFTINTLNPAETSFDVNNVNYNIGNDDLNIACPGLQGSLINLVKGMIVDQIRPAIDKMINSLSDTLLCSTTVPVDDSDISQGFQCPMNAPASATAGEGCTVNDDCADGYTCQSNLCKTGNVQCNLYNAEDPTTENYKCVTGYCEQNTGQCVVAPYCMETANQCWKQKLGVDGRIDIMGLIGSFIETTSHSWLNFYLNLGNYAKAQSNGMSIGVLAGTSSDWNPCVTPSNKEFNKIIPEITMFNDNTLNGNPYHVGLGISQYFFNQLLDSAYNGGALCLDIDSKVSSMITTDLFGLLIPSINNLTSKVNSALMIAIRPKTAPFITVGPGNTNDNGDIIIDQALLNVKINDLDLDFYAFLNDRYVRIFTTTIDLNLGINLDVDGAGKLIPVLAPIKFSTEEELGALSNLRVSNSEILRETNAGIAELLPGVVEMAMGMLPLNFDAIALPSFMGFGIDIKDITQITEGNDDETKNFIGIFANILIGVETPQNITLNNIILEHKTVPRIKNLRKGKKVSYTFRINSELGSNIEYQYRINKGFWSPFKKGNLVKVNNPILKLQGKYNIDIRARKIGETKTLSKITTKTVIVDAISPKISIKQAKNTIKISAKDNITNNVKYFVSIDNSAYTEYTKTPSIKIPTNKQSMLVKVKTIDESGNESTMSRRFNFDNRRVLNTNNLQNEKEETGCSYGGNNSNKSVFIIFLIAIIALLARKKNLLLLLMASFTIFFYGCSDNGQNGNSCKIDKDCDNGKICVEEICVTGNRCEDGSEDYTCSECYIPGRCTEPTGDNPCNEGCECNVTFGQCFKIEGYCTGNDDCQNDDYECKENLCVPKRCENDNECVGKVECDGDHSHPICNQAGACSCFQPCDGGCPNGKFCCLDESNTNDYNQCLENPEVCDLTCDPGYEIKVTDEGNIDEMSCKRVGVQCECIEKPHLKLGTIGLYAKPAVWNDGTSDRVIVVAYNSLYKDLVLGLYDKDKETLDNEHITWTFIDGILNDGEDSAEITNGPTGPRGGISQLGIDVGEYASVAVGTDNKIHISYYDKEHHSLRYVTVKKHEATDDTDTQLWDISTPIIVDQGSDTRDTGYYTSITLDNSNNPTITYMTKDYKDGNNYKSSLNVAILKPDNTWATDILDSATKDLPCNNSCAANQKCLFDDNAVLACQTNLVTDTFNSTDNNLTIPDNNPSGVSSTITIPSNTQVKEFRISYKIDHQAAGHIKIVLISPEGREYLLVNAVTDPNTVDNNTPDGITLTNKKLNQIKNIDAGGTWVLKVIDTHYNIQGTLKNWAISIKSLADKSPYCGATCQETQETCNPACSSTGSEKCASDGVCKKEAKEVTAKYYLNGVGLFNKSVKFGNNIGITYYDSINGNLKYIHYKPSTMNIIEKKIIDSGKVGRNANSTVINNVVHITYRDKAGNLRYLQYSPTQSVNQSLLIDDGLRITDGKFSIHKIGSDSIVVENGINEYDIYYYDATSRNVLFKHYKNSDNSLDGNPSIFEELKEKDDASYDGSFGFYLNHLKLDNKDVFSTFYYRTQVGQKVDADYNALEKPDSMGKVRIIEK